MKLLLAFSLNFNLRSFPHLRKCFEFSRTTTYSTYTHIEKYRLYHTIDLQIYQQKIINLNFDVVKGGLTQCFPSDIHRQTNLNGHNT